MPELSWIAEIVFFGSYFAAWCANQLPHVLWVSVSAWAALVIAVLLVLFHGYAYSRRPAGQA